MMKRSKSVVLAIALSGAPFVFAQAPAAEGQSKAVAVVPADQQPTANQLDRLFEVMRIKDQLASLTKTMPQIMQQQITQQMEELHKDHPELANLTPAQKEKVEKVMTKFMNQAVTLYSGDEIIADIKGIYQRHLTGNDVENLITFYGSTSGQHMLDMVPVIMQEFMPTAMQKMQAKMRPMLAELSKEMAEIMATPSSAGAPGTAKPDQQK
jgi:hypothetical protein